VAALLEAARVLGAREQRPADDMYFVLTTSAEVGGIGGSYASRTLPGDLTIAIEVGPTEAEYATAVSGGPVVAYTDALSTYDKRSPTC
jgi:putative aminopeptidase FrvX